MYTERNQILGKIVANTNRIVLYFYRKYKQNKREKHTEKCKAAQVD